MDDSSDEEENVMDILKRHKAEEERAIKQLAESAKRRQIMEAEAALEKGKNEESQPNKDFC